VAYIKVATWLMRPLGRARILHPRIDAGKEEGKVHPNPITTASHAPLRCPFCEVYEHIGHDCPSCGGFFSEGFLEALRRLTDLPGISPASLVRAPADTATRR
jgi:hypothetical protein